jgi:hypothetical protein
MPSDAEVEAARDAIVRGSQCGEGCGTQWDGCSCRGLACAALAAAEAVRAGVLTWPAYPCTPGQRAYQAMLDADAAHRAAATPPADPPPWD